MEENAGSNLIFPAPNIAPIQGPNRSFLEQHLKIDQQVWDRFDNPYQLSSFHAYSMMIFLEDAELD